MNRDDQRIMARRDLMRARRDQAPGVAARTATVRRALERDQREDRDGDAHAASSSSPAQVKPGPNAVIITRSGRPRSSRRSSTNSTVGALILPKSRSTSRSRLSSPWLQLERGLDRVDDLGPAGMAAEAHDVLARDAELGAHLVDGFGEIAPR